MSGILKAMKKSAFTLVELMIVVAIVLILAAAATGGALSVLRNLRFSNAFNKAVFIVQEARNLAINEKGTAASYRVEITGTTLNLFALDSTTAIDSYALQNMPNATFYSRAVGSSGDCTPAEIKFAKGAVKTTLICAGADNPASLIVGLSDPENNLDKSFTIHKAAGIPQL